MIYNYCTCKRTIAVYLRTKVLSYESTTQTAIVHVQYVYVYVYTCSHISSSNCQNGLVRVLGRRTKSRAQRRARGGPPGARFSRPRVAPATHGAPRHGENTRHRGEPRFRVRIGSRLPPPLFPR
eukprot:31128-Pelagococcus_subviridis.AAC.6